MIDDRMDDATRRRQRSIASCFFFFFSFSKIDDERFQARFQARLHDNRISSPFFFVRKFGTRNLEPVVFGGKTFPSDRNLNSRRRGGGE